MYRPGSYFDGGLLEYLGYAICAFLITVLTFGIAAPWGMVMLYRWQIEHTVVDGHRLSFDGTGGELFGRWILWFFLTIITFGIFGFWVKIKVLEWIAMHTHHMN